MNSIKEFNVKIDGNTSETFSVGANATNIDFSNNAADPFKNEQVETSVPDEFALKASNIIYGNGAIHNNQQKTVDGTANVDDSNYAKASNGLSAQNVTKEHLTASPGVYSISYGVGSIARGHNSVAIGFDCDASGWASHAEGWKTKVDKKGQCAHAEGTDSKASHYAAHAEGDHGIAAGHSSHAEGRNGQAYGIASHAEGKGCIINAQFNTTDAGTKEMDLEMHDINFTQRLNGQGSHAEGLNNTINSGAYCHAEGIQNTIGTVYGSTVMGQHNQVHSHTSVAMGSYNYLPAGQNDCLMIGTHAGLGANESNSCVFAVGGGDKDNWANLMTIRKPASGIVSETNKGDLWGGNMNAHFGTLESNGNITTQKSYIAKENIYTDGYIWTKSKQTNYMDGSLRIGGNLDVAGAITSGGSWGYGVQWKFKCQIASASGHVADLKDCLLDVKLNEESKTLLIVFRPFNGMNINGSWNTNNIKVAKLWTIFKGTNTPYLLNADNISSGTKENANKIINAINHIVWGDHSTLYVSHGTEQHTFACSMQPKLLFGLDNEEGSQAPTGGFRIRALSSDYSTLNNNIPHPTVAGNTKANIQNAINSALTNVHNILKEVGLHKLSGHPSFVFTFQYYKH